MSGLSAANPVRHVQRLQSGDARALGALHAERLRLAKSLYRKDLLCHYGCVNAIEFSKDGEFLVSGGDDRRVLLWRCGQALFDAGQPAQMTTQHQSNVFCLTMSADNTRIYSGGNDEQVIVHDVKTKCVVEVLVHQKAVCGVSLDPANYNIIATAGNDGRLLVFDTRQSVDESMVVSRSRKEYNGVQFHPWQSWLLAAANARDGASLWDLRMGRGAVLRYGGGAPLQNCMSVCWDARGRHVLCLRRRLPPALFPLLSPEPCAHFYHPDYYNSCTVKSACFAGDRDQFVLSGSDDFNVYMWKVPDAGGSLLVDETHMVLCGHRSIVNQVRYNKQNSIIASSGVEKIIKTWSTMKLPGSSGSLMQEQCSADKRRDVYSHEEYVSLAHDLGQSVSHNCIEKSTCEDPRMMAFFDSLVQREMEGWSAELTDSESPYSAAGALPSLTHTQAQAHTQAADSSDSDQPHTSTTHKRAAGAGVGGLRSGRCSSRIVRLLATRQSKLLRLAQKGKGARRSSSSSRQQAVVCSSGNSSVRARCSLARLRRGLRRGALSPPPDKLSTSSTADRHTQGTHRHASKMTRSNRRRMGMSRNYKRKNKLTISYRGKPGGMPAGVDISQLHHMDSAFSEEDLAVASTSTGIRGYNSSLFRVRPSDSDDDDDPSPPSTCSPGHTDTPAHIHLSHLTHTQEEEDVREHAWNRDNIISTYTPTTSLAHLRSETNESEVESSCSTGGEGDRAETPDVATPDSGIILGAPWGSAPLRESSPDNPKHKQRIRRARRNYRTHLTQSDSA